MGRNDAKTQRWLPNAFALRSSDWRLCGMPGRGRPRDISTLYAAVCDSCRRRKLSAAHCQGQGHLAAAAGAANAAAAQPVPPGARCAHTSHGAAPGPQQPANNPTLLPLPVSPGHVARTPRSAGQHHSSRRRRRRAEPLQLPGWQRDASSGRSIVVRHSTAGTFRGRHR